MARRLSAHEIALWSRVAATVRPIAGRPKPPPAPPPVKTAPIPTPRPAPSGPPPRPLRQPARPTVAAATLDGGWDRRLRQGDVSPDRVIDLHGYTLAAAHALLTEALDRADASGDRLLLIITGKGREGRGRIRAELNHWLDSGQHRHRIAALRPAHARHGGGGAFYLILRRH
jgi:DNA-nicking Smr family endonuclease